MTLRVLIQAADVSRRVEQLAAEIADDFTGTAPVVIGILNGAAPFMMELLRCLPEAMTHQVFYDFVDATSYRGTESTGAVELTRPLTLSVTGRHVLVVDGIVDTGRTLAAVLEYVNQLKPARVSTCTLLDKSARRQVEVPIDYRGFEIDDLFVVGYGMDLDGQFRGFRHIAVIDSPAA